MITSEAAMTHPHRSSQSDAERRAVRRYTAPSPRTRARSCDRWRTRARGNPYGEFYAGLVYSSPGDLTGRIVMYRADPELALSHEMFGWLLVDEVHEDVEFTPGEGGAYEGSVIKIHALNGTFIYRVERFLDTDRGWLIRWPD